MQTIQADKLVINSQTIPKIISNHCPQYLNRIIKMQVLKGLTNITYKVSVEGLANLVFRKFGGTIDRSDENVIYHELQKVKVAPKCLYACQKYRIQQFIQNGRHPSNDQLADKILITRIMNKIYDFHKVVIPNLKFTHTLVDELVTKQQYKRISQLQNNKNVDKFQILHQEILLHMADTEQLHQIIPSNKNTVRFCHNDLNNLNILVTPAQVFLIDFEYAKYNYLAFEIANFLNQTTIDYLNPSFPGFNLIRTLTIRQIQQATHQYPQKYDTLTEDIIRSLCACNLYWAIWSIVGAVNPNKGVFSIVEHGLMRMKLYNQYRKLLNQYLSYKKTE